MRTKLITTAILASSFVLTGCYGLIMVPGMNSQPPVPSALIVNKTKASINCEHTGDDGCAAAKEGKPVGSHSGEACAHSVLALIQVGDMSLKAAAADGKITEVQSVDYSASSFLFSVYAQRCLIVNGK